MRVASGVVTGLCCLAAGCLGPKMADGPGSDVGNGPEETHPVRHERSALPPPPAPHSVLLLDTDQARATARMMEVQLTGKLGTPSTVEVSSLPERDDWFVLPAFADETGWMLWSKDGLVSASWGHPSASDPRKPSRVDALLRRGDDLFIGVGATVQHARGGGDLSMLVDRSQGRSKAYDHLRLNGDFLLAVDDRMMPFYADLFDISGGTPARVGDWVLPGLVNGTYVDASLVLPDPTQATGTVYLVSNHVVYSGAGNTLHRVPFRQGTLQEPAEHAAFVDGTRTENASFSWWTAVAPLPDPYQPTHIAVAARAQGILLFPPGFTGNETPTVAARPGVVLDAVRVGAELLTLVDQAEQSELIRYRLQSNRLEEESRIALPGHWTNIAR